MSAGGNRRVVAVDFDGTLAVTKFPEIIKPIPKMVRHCRKLREGGAILILWTCRCGKDLESAVEWCRQQGLKFDYVNENVPGNIGHFGNDCRKIFAHEYIDDKAVNPVREAAWIRRVWRLYEQRYMAAAGIAAVLVIVIEAAMVIVEYFT